MVFWSAQLPPVDCHRTMNTGRAVADGFDDGDAVTCDVGGTSAVGEAGDSEPVGDEAGEFDVVDGAGTVVDATLVVVVAASLGTTLLEPASGVPCVSG